MLPASLAAFASAVLFSSGIAAAVPSADAPSAQRKSTRAAAEKPYGRPGDPRKARRTIAIDMSDTMRFFPESITVKRGDTVRFELRNSGQLPHEMVIGTMDDLKQRAGERVVQPGEKRRFVWQFTRPGEFYFACLVPGHFEAGMMGTIVVR